MDDPRAGRLRTLSCDRRPRTMIRADDRLGHEGRPGQEGESRPARRGQHGRQRWPLARPATNQVFTIHNINSGNGSLRGRLVRARQRSYVPASGVWERPRGPSPDVRVSRLRGLGSGAVLFLGREDAPAVQPTRDSENAGRRGCGRLRIRAKSGGHRGRCALCAGQDVPCTETMHALHWIRVCCA